jgi:Ca-activated chloride channel family protein
VRFELPWLIWLAPLAAALTGLLAWWAARRRVALSVAWSARLAPLARQGWKSSIILLGVAGFAVGLAAAGPRGGRMEHTEGREGLNVLIAVDVSKSMLAEDGAPNRLKRAIREATRLVQDLPDDRIGVLAFAGQAYLLSPLTLDHAAVRLYLETLDPDLASTGGTHMGPLLAVSNEILTGSREGGDRVLLVFTDGEGHDSLDASLDAARELKGEGIRLILVGQGGSEPARIPVRDAAGVITEYQRDGSGKPVLTYRRDEVLNGLAGAAEGVVIPADLPDQAGAIRDQLSALSRRPLSERRLADLSPLAWIGALIGLLLLLAHTVTRRGAALAALALLFAGGLTAQETPRGDRLVRAGRNRDAASAYRADAQAGRGGDTAWYNAGTAALAAGDLDGARDALLHATRSLDPGLRFRAHYNLGLVLLQQSRRDTTARSARQAEAAAQFKQALLLEPQSRDAKWNLELLVRRPPPPSPSASQQQQQQQQQQSAGGLAPNQADAILSSVEQNEAATRQSVVRRQRLRASTSTRDW